MKQIKLEAYKIFDTDTERFRRTGAHTWFTDGEGGTWSRKALVHLIGAIKRNYLENPESCKNLEVWRLDWHGVRKCSFLDFISQPDEQRYWQQIFEYDPLLIGNQIDHGE